MNWRILKKISAILLAVKLLAIVANIVVFFLVGYGLKGADFVGCYAYDAMLIGFECQGFWGSTLVAAWLNWPLWLIYAPMFAVFSFRAFVIALLVWMPLVVFVTSTIKLRGVSNA